MAGRIRSIKPEILEDERSAGLSSDAWRLWVSLWLLSDDLGRVRGEPRRLAASVFWACPHPVDVAGMLEELENAGCIIRYVVRGQQYLEIQNWSKHQRIDNASKYHLPGREEADSLAANGGESQQVSAVRGSEKEKEQEKEKDLFATESRDRFDFDPIYASYPRHEGKTDGMKKARRDIKTEADYQALQKAVANYAAKCKAEATDAKFIKQWSTFMGCWRDYVDAVAVTHSRSGSEPTRRRMQSAEEYAAYQASLLRGDS